MAADPVVEVAVEDGDVTENLDGQAGVTSVPREVDALRRAITGSTHHPAGHSAVTVKPRRTAADLGLSYFAPGGGVGILVYAFLESEAVGRGASMAGCRPGDAVSMTRVARL